MATALAGVLTGALGLATAALSLPAAAQELRRDVPIEITADQILYEARRQVYVAEGSVRVVQAESRIDADWLVFNRTTRRGIAAGDVRVSDGDSVLEARFVEFDQVGGQGLVISGRLDMGEGDFRIAAGELVKTGENTFEAEDASFTTCRCPDDEDRLPWVINASDADVEIGDYATVKNTTVDVLGVPTVWLPWAMFPVKTERASGVLLPEFKLGGGNGFEVALPLFWAARDNVNVIVTPRYMTKRGFKPEVLVETVYGEKSSTEIFGSYIRDQDPSQGTVVEINPNPPPTTLSRRRNLYDTDRWAVALDNDIHAPLGIRLRSDIQVVSDNEYVRDFAEFQELRRDRFLESTAFGFRHFGGDGSGAIVASALYRDDRQNPDRADRDDFVLQRAPNTELAWLPTRVEEVGGFELGFEVDYTNYWSDDKASNVLDLTATSAGPQGNVIGDDLFVDIGIGAIPDIFAPSDINNRRKFGIGDGEFQEGEPLNDEGHRVILNPHLGHSFRLLDVLDVRPEVGWHQTLYSTDAQSFESRGLFTGRLDVTSQLVGTADLPGLPPLQHLLEPRVGWAYVSSTGQRNNPLFVPRTKVPETRLRQLSLDNVVLDSADRIDNAALLTVGFGNHFYAGRGVNRHLRAEFDASVGYDFADGSGDFQLAILDGEIFARSGIKTKFHFAYDLDETRVEEGLFELFLPMEEKLGLKKSSYLSLGYRYRQAVGLFFESFEASPRVDDVSGTFNRFESEFTRISQVTAATRLKLTDGWALNYQVGYSLHRSVLLTNRGAVEYTSSCKCWAIQVQAEDHRSRGFQAGLSFTLLGFGTDVANPFSGGGMLGTGQF